MMNFLGHLLKALLALAICGGSIFCLVMLFKVCMLAYEINERLEAKYLSSLEAPR